MILLDTMRRPAILLTAVAAAAACSPTGPVYLGPPRVVLSGSVQVFEAQQPIPNAEVCVFGTDTLCVATDQHGDYSAGMAQGMLLEGDALTVRFRVRGLPTAVAELEGVVPGEPLQVDCAISNRFALSNRPVTCLPVQR